MSTARTEARLSGGYRRVLANPGYRRLWAGQLAERVAEAIAQVALPLLVYDVTGSARLMSVIFVIQMLPRAILAPVAGLLADRLDRRRLMVAACATRMIGMASLIAVNEVWQIAAVAAFIAVGTALIQPVEMAVIPLIAGEDQLVPALSLTQVTGATTRIVGPALGAAIVGVAGPDPAFGLVTLSFAAATTAFWGLSIPRPIVVRSGRLLETAWRDVAEGGRAVWRTPVVRGVTAAEGLWSLLGASLTISAVVYTEESLKLGDRAELVYGLLAATLSAGAVLGALVAGRLERRIGRARLMAIGYLGPLLLLPVGLVPPLPFVFVCWFALGFTDAWAVIAMQAYLAESVPDALRGRVFATWGGVVALGLLGSYALVGVLTDALGAPAMLALAGGLVGFGGPLLLRATGALRSVTGAEVGAS